MIILQNMTFSTIPSHSEQWVPLDVCWGGQLICCQSSNQCSGCRYGYALHNELARLVWKPVVDLVEGNICSFVLRRASSGCWESDQDSPGRLLLKVVQARPTGKRLRGNPEHTRGVDISSDLGTSRDAPGGGLAGENDVWTTATGSGGKRLDGWFYRKTSQSKESKNVLVWYQCRNSDIGTCSKCSSDTQPWQLTVRLHDWTLNNSSWSCWFRWTWGGSGPG